MTTESDPGGSGGCERDEGGSGQSPPGGHNKGFSGSLVKNTGSHEGSGSSEM